MTPQESFAAALNVSRETLAMFGIWETALRSWQRRINLVSDRTLDEFWTRHALDSAQLAALIPPGAQSCIDLGSGGGFPVLALAIMLRDRRDLSFTAVESNAKKAGFIRDVATQTGLKMRILNARIEDVPPSAFDVVTARALAPLDRLARFAERFSGADTLWIFPKGVGYEDEWVQSDLSLHYERRIVPSLTDTDARILVLKRKSNGHEPD